MTAGNWRVFLVCQSDEADGATAHCLGSHTEPLPDDLMFPGKAALQLDGQG